MTQVGGGNTTIQDAPMLQAEMFSLALYTPTVSIQTCPQRNLLCSFRPPLSKKENLVLDPRKWG